MSQKIFEVQGLQVHSRYTQVKETLRAIPGVQSVNIDPWSGSVEVEYDPLKTDPVQMRHALEQRGIEAADWPPED